MISASIVIELIRFTEKLVIPEQWLARFNFMGWNIREPIGCACMLCGVPKCSETVLLSLKEKRG